ncbi:hypothetical protein BC827DRAFT_526186 [Russula dissimulans]|nr:hypothetical protein BC827DRAFT_526186 [Russula dissimulans]
MHTSHNDTASVTRRNSRHSTTQTCGFFHRAIQLSLYPKTEAVDRFRRLVLEIKCRELDYKLSSLAHVCSLSFPIISALEELQIREGGSLSSSHRKDDMENAQWLELLDPFTGLKNLNFTDGIAQRFFGALQELSGERITEVLIPIHHVFVLCEDDSVEHLCISWSSWRVVSSPTSSRSATRDLDRIMRYFSRHRLY